MSLQSNAMAYMQKARQIQNENWHEDFFATMPKLTHTVKVKNPKTNVESTIILEGLAAFFN